MKFMKYAGETGSDAMIDTPAFIKIGWATQKLMEGRGIVS
jgi:hypothetical protein